MFNINDNHILCSLILFSGYRITYTLYSTFLLEFQTSVQKKLFSKQKHQVLIFINLVKSNSFIRLLLFRFIT